MGRLTRTTCSALLVLALSACTGGAPDAVNAPPANATASATAAAVETSQTPDAPAGDAATGEAVSLEDGKDVGNGRPASSHDGLMVRRRTVIAVHQAEGTDPGSLRQRLDEAASQQGIELTDISPMVLDALLLDHLVPDVIVALPAGRSHEDADRLAELAFGQEGTNPAVEHVHIGEALVHDLAFTLAVEDPAALAAAIAGEGILSDALGNYEESLDGGALTIGYTGPLLSDELVESVRDGMARSGGKAPADVGLAPRSPSGDGVDLSKEPAPDAVEGADDSGHHEAGTDDTGH
ncbi:hypothetical protein BJG92_02485 [Arthrobacter sp. SO5]|uniref:hypothetical protein n=1 Tax=Arthrobacter sp. SO5 TaxID=1897055 RepID=UPI001E34FC03|nr:hypothetical protein [Arthrobacter sp. SO5]MCB5274947.1 hypothetical protein [Arthrobacter sp. SO5]